MFGVLSPPGVPDVTLKDCCDAEPEGSEGIDVDVCAIFEFASAADAALDAFRLPPSVVEPFEFPPASSFLAGVETISEYHVRIDEVLSDEIDAYDGMVMVDGDRY